MGVRSFLAWPLKWALKKNGKGIIDLDRYGYDAFSDIQRLSQAWKYPIEVFFDVGANEGGVVRYARQYFRNCRITAFEPHPKTFTTLKEKMANVQDVELINLALGSEIGDKAMFDYDLSLLNSLLPNGQFAVRFEQKASQIQVTCTTLDKFCSERGLRQIDVLKIDTEGFDFEVLAGASEMLARRAIRFIYFEFNDIESPADSSGGALLPIDQLIRPCGFRFIATYNDYVVSEGELFLVSNALYALPPTRG